MTDDDGLFHLIINLKFTVATRGKGVTREFLTPAVIQTGFIQIELHFFPFVVRVTNCLPSYLKTHMFNAIKLVSVLFYIYGKLTAAVSVTDYRGSEE